MKLFYDAICELRLEYIAAFTARTSYNRCLRGTSVSCACARPAILVPREQIIYTHKRSLQIIFLYQAVEKLVFVFNQSGRKGSAKEIKTCA